jgi:hypothetical protein
VIVHVVGRDDLVGQRSERLVVLAVERIAVVDQFDVDVFLAEVVFELAQCPGRRLDPLVSNARRTRPLRQPVRTATWPLSSAAMASKS